MEKEWEFVPTALRLYIKKQDKCRQTPGCRIMVITLGRGSSNPGSIPGSPKLSTKIAKSFRYFCYNKYVKTLEIKCYYCSKKFKRLKGRINEASKFGWKNYCNLHCQYKLRTTRKTLKCSNLKCKNTFQRELNDIGTKNFCSQSCAAVFNNRLRVRTKKPLTVCVAENCDNLVKDRHCIYCSRKCGALARKRTIESLKREVLSKIRIFYKLNKRIPVKKEMYALYGKARGSFGTWNNAIEAAGYKPNPVMFAKKYIAQDSHKCDSLNIK